MPVRFQHITIIGIGLIGGSTAMALRRADPSLDIRGIDSDPSTCAAALNQGACSDVASPTDEVVGEWLSGDGSDLVIICTPVPAVRDWFEQLESGGFAGVITDVASTKHVICAVADDVLSHLARYIPGHPMAGREVSGIEAARADLFEGAYWILCPDADTDPDDFAALHDLFKTIGARIISIDRERHDEAVAIVSHVPHMVASALMAQAGSHADKSQGLLRLAAGGFKDSTRVAAGSPELWCGIAMDNREALASGLHEFRDILGTFEEAIMTGDGARLTELLDASARLRRSLPARWIPDSSRLTEMRINMTDRSGVIAEVTGYTGQAGCNIQSISIDHISEDSAILDLVLTDEGDMGRLCGLLMTAGFNVSFRPVTPEE
jgi:prephenate dehydrogenase